MSGFECLNCRKISQCGETSEERAKQKYCCTDWEAASPETIAARNRILILFADQGLKSILETETKEA